MMNMPTAATMAIGIIKRSFVPPSIITVAPMQQMIISPEKCGSNATIPPIMPRISPGIKIP